MVTKSKVPNRGEIIWLNFDPARGHEQRGQRPALVISPAVYNVRSGLALVCPITSQKRYYPFAVKLSGEKVSGFVLVDQLKSIDWKERGAEYTDTVDGPTWQIVEQLLGRLIH